MADIRIPAPAAGLPAVKPAAANAKAEPAVATPAPAADANQIATPEAPKAAPVDANEVAAPEAEKATPATADIDNVNLDPAELRALDNLMQTYLADGAMSAAETKTYQEIRTLFSKTPAAAGGDTPVGQDPVAGGASTSPSGESDPVGGSSPNSPSWDHGSNVVEGRSFSSVGDPHETSGDGGKFDNMKEGAFVKARSASGDFELQTVQGKDKSGNWPNATVNLAAAVKSGKDVVAYNAVDQTLTVNGEKKDLKDGETFQLPGGGSVTKNGGTIDIETAAGDKVRLEQRDQYVDVSGEIGPNRKDGEVRGSLGNFDADTDAGNDLLGRDGKPVGAPNDPAAVDKFIEEWRATPEENLFGDDPIGQTGPGAGDTAEVKGDKDLFKQLDLNQDNVLDGKEVQEEQKAFDLNQDGNVDLMEFLKGRDEARKAQGGGEDPKGGAGEQPVAEDDAAIEADFTARDITGNGVLTGTEIPADYKAANPDATKVTLEEYRAFRKQLAEADKAEFAKADINQDGMLDGKEAEPFAGFDLDQNGEISEAEALKAKEEKRAAERAAELATFLKQIEERRLALAGEATPPEAPAQEAPAAAEERAAAPVA